ncbi:hypothetical protein SEMRO_2337_G323860.1 [Seminavis robusta]|uniref:Uncharacterized protein n=1 Tax=Seminavis robusta TaxID=568900 RepID=A0A9N8HX22_9STRA|nr:hypothetical protein SEMRO_2337_G323860.1 [Seminavis robusta]|eukprot:Sro2337_g323860.1 n/a (217) ;mRNA; r:4574-5224
MSSLCNDEVKIAFFSKRSGYATAVSNDTLAKIVAGIKHGIERCIDRACDVDMFACIQGEKYIPNSLPINLKEINATMETGGNGDLRFKTKTGNHTLHVLFSGGGTPFRVQIVDRPQENQTGRVHRRPPRQNMVPPPRNDMGPPTQFPSGQAQRRESVRNRQPSDDSSSSEHSPARPIKMRRRQPTAPRPPPSDSDDSSSAEEYNDFSQLTGRRKRT